MLLLCWCSYARLSSHEGTSCLASTRMSSRSFVIFPFLSLKKDVANPRIRIKYYIIAAMNHIFNVVQLIKHGARDIGCSRTQVSNSSRAPDAVDIFLNVTGQVKVNHMLHVGDVQTPSCYLDESKGEGRLISTAKNYSASKITYIDILGCGRHVKSHLMLVMTDYFHEVFLHV